MGYSFRQKPDFIAHGSTLVIQPKDITSDGILIVDKTSHVALSTGNSLTQGDVLLINRGRFTAVVFGGTVNEPCVASSAFLIVTPKDTAQLLPDYLALFFNSAEGQTIFKRLTETTTIPFISLSNLKSIEIPLPPLARQKALAEFNELNKAYIRLSNRKAQLQQQIINQQIVRAGFASAQ